METSWPRLDLQHVLWFFGAITTSIATIAVLDEIPESSSDVWLLLASLGFLAAYGLAAIVLARRDLRTPSGLMATVSASIVPAVAYALTQLIGVYPTDADPLNDFSGAILTIGLVSTLAAPVAFALTGFTFALGLFVGAALLTVQLAVASSSGDGHALAAVVSGGVAVALGLLLDLRARRRAAFWFYVGGYLAVGGGLLYYVFSGFGSGGGTGAWLALLLVGCAVLLGAAFLTRSTWAAYGALGVYAALSHYLSAHEWVRYVLLAASLAVFVLGLAARTRPARPTSS